MSDFVCPDETLYFLKNLPIELNYKNKKRLTNSFKFDVKLFEKPYVWHQIVVVHKGKVRGVEGRKMILDALFDAVGDEEFFPIAYRSGYKEDKFLLRNCLNAMRKLFENSLRLQLTNSVVVYLEYELNIGIFKFGQISPANVINQALDDLYGSMERVNGEDGILNLSNFSEHSEFVNMIVSLRNRSVFSLVCNSIYKNHDKFRNVNGLILRNNGITTLGPLDVFNGIEFAVLDLRNNKLSSAARVCSALTGIKANALYLNGNPIVSQFKYPSSLDYILKNFVTLDDIPVKNLSKDYNPINIQSVVRDNKGYKISKENKSDIECFSGSTNWHLVVVNDEEAEISKEELFDYFFIIVSPNYTDLYPCYYKFSDGKHQFLLRECFDQLQYLVKECNLEINVPCLTNPDEDACSMNVHIRKVIDYYLYMDFMRFQQGQIESFDVIDKALTKCFDPMDRVYNLENFQATEGLENIIINLTSPNILNRLLMMAARKCVGNCNDLRLARNKILTVDFIKTLTFMRNLTFIDLGNNWIQDFESIKQLSQLQIKSLRLDGNPLCSKYSSGLEYANDALKYFPNLQILDNVDIKAIKNFTTQQNYICDVSAYDFVEKFVSNYLRQFETKERETLKGWYHKDALFSMTCHYYKAHAYDKLQNRIATYENRATNLLRPTTAQQMFKGPQRIINLFKLLPAIRYDMLSIKTDTVAFNENIVVIVISGVFQDQPKDLSEADFLLAFFRTFVLVPVELNCGILKGSTKYQIINDQLNITKPSFYQLKNSFIYFKKDITQEISPLTTECKEALLVIFNGVTNLKNVWCRRLMDDAKWNFRDALNLFTQLFEQKEIPKTAYKKKT